MNLIIALLFALTPSCNSDHATNCHRPAKDAAHTVIYVNRDGNPDHDLILTGKAFR